MNILAYYQLDYQGIDQVTGVMSSLESKNQPQPITCKSVIAPKYDADVKAILDHAGLIALTYGMKLTVTLQELLTIAPRTRKRIDSYASLVRYLREQHGVELIITSNKTKYEE